MNQHKFVVKNFHGVAATVAQNHELRREISMKKKKKLSLGKNVNTNMVKAIEDIKQHDMQSRITSIGKE